jgi:hypothetical protein
MLNLFTGVNESAKLTLYNVTFAIIGTIFLSTNSIHAQTSRHLDTKEAVLVAEAQHLCKQCGDMVWPGLSSERAPILLVSGEYEYAIGFPEHFADFIDIGDDTIANARVQLGNRTHEKNLCAAFDVSGVHAVVVGSPEETGFDGAQWILKVVHEMFHVFQYNHGAHRIRETGLGKESSDGSWMLNYPFPYSDREIMESIHVQGYLLWVALQQDQKEESLYALGTIEEALKIHATLLHSRQPSGSQYLYQRFEEWLEGVALYVEYKMAKASTNRDLYQALPEFLRLQNTVSYQDAWNDRYVNMLFLVKHAGKAAKSRGSFYHLGMGKSLLLDKLPPTWKERCFDPNIWLDDLIAAAVATTQK